MSSVEEYEHGQTFFAPRPILTFDEDSMVGLAGTGFGEFDEELTEEVGDLPIDILRAIVGMDPWTRNGKPSSSSSRAVRSAASLTFSTVQTTSICVIASTALM